MEYFAENIDVAVIGAGHAGVEAGLASARLGVNTVIFTMSLDVVANLPCNPSIGGTAKGHLVRELDALGGEMGKAADAVMLQSRLLNRGKGPAVHSLRAQVDRIKYQRYMKWVVENQPNLRIKQAEIIDIRTKEGKVSEIVTSLGAVYGVKNVVIATGTFLGGRIYIGDVSYPGGPDGHYAANELSNSLKKLDIKLKRFKTGTPARVHKDSIDFSQLEEQEGDNPITPFSFETDPESLKNILNCHIGYTNEDTHAILRDNIHRSPMYSGKIEGIGARYCPSIEDKVVRFADKQRHQIFVEPMWLDTKEMYLQGVSTSMPEDIQIKMLRSIKGFENIEIMRNAYAIEYDCIDSTQLNATLEFKEIGGLFGAGQFNGTSGYEEAAVQGFVAGVNAANNVIKKEPLVLDRSNSYIGTLIDDLVVKGCLDPYRMMTSRSEYRLLLRQDNADERLTPIGRKVGLISDERWQKFNNKMELKQKEIKRILKVSVPPSDALNKLLDEKGTTKVKDGAMLADLLRRPQLSYSDLAPFDPNRDNLPLDVCETVEIHIKYEGYIKKQIAQVEQMHRLEKAVIPDNIDYSDIKGIRLEAREKLTKLRPMSVGQASRISGVSPADISVLLIYLEQKGRG